MLRALGVFSSFPSIVVGLFLVTATMAVFVHALGSVVSEVRLSDTMDSRNAASPNAPHVDGEDDAAATSVDDTTEANGANEAQAEASEPTTVLVEVYYNR